MTENEKKNDLYETTDTRRSETDRRSSDTRGAADSQRSARDQRIEELIQQRESTEKKQNKYIRILIPLLLVIVILVAAGLYIRQRLIRYYQSLDPVEMLLETLDEQLRDGDDADEEDYGENVYGNMLKNIYRLEQEGVYDFSIASAIVFESPDGSGEARIENTGYHFYYGWVSIRLDDTQEYVYASNEIMPFNSEETIYLDQELEPGEYDATATFSAMSFEDDGFYGQKEVAIKLYVLDGNTSKEKVLSESEQEDLRITMDTDSSEDGDTASGEEERKKETEKETEEEVESGLLDQFGRIFDELLS